MDGALLPKGNPAAATATSQSTAIASLQRPFHQPPLSASDLQEAPALNSQLTRSQRKNQKRREKRATREAAGPYGNWKAQRARRLATRSFSFAAAFPVPRFQASKEDGLTGAPRKNQPGDSKAYALEELQAEGFEVVPWDGITPCSIVDQEGNCYAQLAGRPQDPSYATVIQGVNWAMTNAARALSFSGDQLGHRRGTYPTIAVGMSHGNGSKQPHRLAVRQEQAAAVESLVADPSVRRLAGFINGAFQTFSPKMHTFYSDRMEELREWNPTLAPIFPNSVFAAATFNFGPNVCTYRHRDFNNFSYGWCAITALGDFDHRAGGHLILWEAKKVIEFPAGATIFIPSAPITHSNTPTSPGESRQSFTQYTAGGIFRFISCGFRTKSSLPSGAEMKRWWASGSAPFQ